MTDTTTRISIATAVKESLKATLPERTHRQARSPRVRHEGHGAGGAATSRDGWCQAWAIRAEGDGREVAAL
jgi:hypothetical protein